MNSQIIEGDRFVLKNADTKAELMTEYRGMQRRESSVFPLETSGKALRASEFRPPHQLPHHTVSPSLRSKPTYVDASRHFHLHASGTN